MSNNEFKKRFDKLKRIHNSTNEAVVKMADQNKELQDMIAILVMEKKQWEKEKVNQEQIIQKQLQQMNDEKDALGREIIRLRQKIKKLKNGSFN